MKKIVIFGSEWGVEELAESVEKELGAVIEVEKEIDLAVRWWRRGGERVTKSLACREIRQRIEKMLLKYIGKVDLVILASYTGTAAALEYLSEKYPEQKFMGFEPRIMRNVMRRGSGGVSRWWESDKCQMSVMVKEWRSEQELKEYKGQLNLKRRIEMAWYGVGRRTLAENVERFMRCGEKEKILVLASEPFRKSAGYQVEKREFQRSFMGQFQVVEPKCERWLERTADGEGGLGFSKDAIRTILELGKVKAVVIYETEFIKVKGDLGELCGAETRILDDYKATVKDISRVLGFGGVGRMA